VNEWTPLRKIRTAQADLSKEGDVTRLFAPAAFGPVQVLIVNHGYFPSADVPIAQMSITQWNDTMASNLTSAFLVVRGYMRMLKVSRPEAREKAAIVLVGSTAGKYGEAGHADYASAKAGESHTLAFPSMCATLTTLQP
jgi:NAD(P)-dependent dehydrogenase (short-subunit alcohol dehydrogenase family)